MSRAAPLETQGGPGTLTYEPTSDPSTSAHERAQRSGAGPLKDGAVGNAPRSRQILVPPGVPTPTLGTRTDVARTLDHLETVLQDLPAYREAVYRQYLVDPGRARASHRVAVEDGPRPTAPAALPGLVWSRLAHSHAGEREAYRAINVRGGKKFLYFATLESIRDASIDRHVMWSVLTDACHSI